MASFNKVILMGNLTRDPELRYTPKGMAIAKIGIAVNRRWTTETGEQREEVTFVDVDAFGKQAETIGQYMRKGSPLLIEGRLKLDQWDDKQTGQKRQRLGVVCENFRFVGSAQRNEDGSAPAPAATTRSRPAAGPAAADGPPDADVPPQEGDDVPF